MSGRPSERLETRQQTPAAFDPDGHESRDRRRRSLIHVRSPHMKRRHRHFETRSAIRISAADRYASVIWMSGAVQRRMDGIQVRTARGAKDQGDPVKKERGCERSQKEILQRRLVRDLRSVRRRPVKHIRRQSKVFRVPRKIIIRSLDSPSSAFRRLQTGAARSTHPAGVFHA